jgi:hypothetical protein
MQGTSEHSARDSAPWGLLLFLERKDDGAVRLVRQPGAD